MDLMSPRKSDRAPEQLPPEQIVAVAMVAAVRNVLGSALDEDVTEHLGREKNQAESSRVPSNVRNGS